MSPIPSSPGLPLVLVAEDNEDDVELLRLSILQSRIALDLRRVRDGEECMRFLRKEGEFADAPTPHLLLLDLNMPRMDGREVMAAIAAEPTLWRVPVVILSTSSSEPDLLAAQRLRFNSFVVKPSDFQQFSKVVRTITEYWLSTVVRSGA